MLIGLTCILLGWTLTSALGPSEDGLLVWDPAYDVASGGILEDPSGFGKASVPSKQPGIIGDSVLGEDENDEHEHERTPSVTSALSELHDAVKDKLHSWNPYFVRPSGSRSNTTKSNSRPHNATAGLLEGETITDGISEHERLGAKVRIGKCTIMFNGNSYWERAIRTHERHNKEHGYRLHVLRQRIMDDVWSKPAYILSLLLRELAKPESERLDWLLWVDADTVLLNPYIPVDVFLPPPGAEFEDINVVYSNDWNGLNNGVFPIRVNQWAVTLFAGIVAYRHFRPNDGLQFRDQSAMDTLMREMGGEKHSVQAPQRWFNAYQGEHNETLAPFQIRRGDFLVHFAGVGDREERMNFWLQRAEQHLDDWEVPLKSTSYPQEARDFWNEQRQIRKEEKEALALQRTLARELLQKAQKRLDDYGDRLAEAQRTPIIEQIELLTVVFDTESTNGDIKIIEEESGKLEDVMITLNTAIAEAHKVLLTSAHEAILVGEKDLLESGFRNGKTDLNLDNLATKVTQLKTLVMTPQEHWDRAQIMAATNAVTEARAKIAEFKAAEAKQRKKIADEKAAKKKEMAALQKQVQKEAGLPVSEDVDEVEEATDEEDATEDVPAAVTSINAAEFIAAKSLALEVAAAAATPWFEEAT